MDSYSMWIVRYTNLLLVCWFLCVSCGLGFWIVKPAFDQYVERLIEQRDLRSETTRAQSLEDRRRRLDERLIGLRANIRTLDATSLANRLRESGNILRVEASFDCWMIDIDVTDQSNPLELYRLLGHVSGLTVDTINVQSADRRITLRLSLIPEERVRWHSVDISALELPNDFQFGQLIDCPAPVVKAQLADWLLVEINPSQIQRLQVGDWLNQDWRFLAYRDQQLIFKNSLGRICVK